MKTLLERLGDLLFGRPAWPSTKDWVRQRMREQDVEAEEIGALVRVWSGTLGNDGI